MSNTEVQQGPRQLKLEQILNWAGYLGLGSITTWITYFQSRCNAWLATGPLKASPILIRWLDVGILLLLVLLLVFGFWRWPRRRGVLLFLFLLCYFTFSYALVLDTGNWHWAAHSVGMLITLRLVWQHHALLKKYTAALGIGNENASPLLDKESSTTR